MLKENHTTAPFLKTIPWSLQSVHRNSVHNKLLGILYKLRFDYGKAIIRMQLAV